MKILGLIGAISWVSTAEYYRLINEGINQQLGGLNFSTCIIYSFNYADIVRNNEANDWESTFQLLRQASKHLASSGASAIVLCANTMHLIADKLQRELNIPVIHIATVTATAIKKTGLKKVGLLGTKFTMEYDFFTSKLMDKGIESLIPAPNDRQFLQDTIFNELGKGILKEETKQRYLSIINQLLSKGAEGIIFGCTEIPLLLKQEDVSVPIFDTTLLHSKAAVDFSLS